MPHPPHNCRPTTYRLFQVCHVLQLPPYLLCIFKSTLSHKYATMAMDHEAIQRHQSKDLLKYVPHVTTGTSTQGEKLQQNPVDCKEQS